MQKDAVDADAVHRCLELAANLAALAHAAHHQFSATVDGAHQFGDGAGYILLGQLIAAIEQFQVAESIALGGDDMQCGVERWHCVCCLPIRRTLSIRGRKLRPWVSVGAI